MKIQVLVSPGCGHGQRTMELIADVLRDHAWDAELETITVSTMEDAHRQRFPGSPTIRVDGVDIEPRAPVAIGLG